MSWLIYISIYIITELKNINYGSFKVIFLCSDWVSIVFYSLRVICMHFCYQRLYKNNRDVQKPIKIHTKLYPGTTLDNCNCILLHVHSPSSLQCHWPQDLVLYTFTRRKRSHLVRWAFTSVNALVNNISSPVDHYTFIVSKTHETVELKKASRNLGRLF